LIYKHLRPFVRCFGRWDAWPAGTGVGNWRGF
jgi:hypothetical protein